MKSKKGQIQIGAVIIVILIIGIVYFGWFNLGNFLGTDCNLGSWTISSYNSQTGDLTIPVNTGNLKFAGCFGTTAISDSGTGISNKKDCEDIGFTWNSEFNRCGLNNEWFAGKTYTNNVVCTLSCTDPRGCGGASLSSGASRIVAIDPGFDGFKMNFPGAQETYNSLGVVLYCTGNIVVHVPLKTEQNKIMVSDNSQTVVTNTPTTTNPSFPTMQETTNTPTETTTGVQDATITNTKLKSTFADNVNNFFINIFNTIKGWFGMK